MFKTYRRGYAELLMVSLGDINDGLFSEALRTDSEESLKELKKADKIKKIREYFDTNRISKLIACVVAIAVAVGVAVGGYVHTRMDREIMPWENFEMEFGEVTIDSLDSLNYYCGRRILSSYTDKNSVASAVTAAFENSQEMSEKSKDLEEEIVHYRFDPSESITVTKVIYFKAELKEINGFLAKKLGGIGPVDVIITENSLEEMITFKRGGSYYSCLMNGCVNESGVTYLEFSTHKYIEGFCVVKNMDQDNYKFKVKIDKRGVTELDCDYDETADGIWDIEADRIGVVNESSRVVNRTATFNISELENFFNAETAKMTEMASYTDRRKWR